MEKPQEKIYLRKPSLKNLYLDPNNYRFIDNGKYEKVSDDIILTDAIQKRTLKFITGEKNEGITDLLLSIKTNGFLPVDQIQVQAIGNGKYKVLEGNRRVAALKMLQRDYEFSYPIGNLNPDIFSNVPVVIFDREADGDFYILTGLKHIEGNRKWPAVNQAQLVKDLVETYSWDTEDIVKALGSTKTKINRYIKTLSLIDQYKKSDFGDQFSTPMFNIFEEIIKKPIMRDWIGWDDENKRATKPINNERLFSWISKDEILIAEGDDERYEPRDPIITKGTDIRELAKFINDEEAINEMEKTRNISEGYLRSDRILTDKFSKSLDVVKFQLGEAFQVSEYADEASKEKLLEIINRVNGLLTTKGYSFLLPKHNIEREVHEHFTNTKYFKSINIEKCKKFENVEIKNLNRINVFAGINNSGKTTLLESIYWLSKQNDIHAFIDVWRRRGKFNQINAEWFIDAFNEEVKINGYVGDAFTSIEVKKEEDTEDEFNKSTYLKTIYITAKYNENTTKSEARIFADKEYQPYFKKIVNVCNSSFSSPFSLQEKEDVLYAHSESVKYKSIQKIVDFINANSDEDINYIEQSTTNAGVRFEVNSKEFDVSKDLSAYGEGVQRVFQIALQFAAAKNGILLIDELENAMHYSLLEEFTQFIQKLANDFDVQVFVTTHSKECIDAFVNNDYKNDEMSFYQLDTSKQQINCKYVSGLTLQKMLSKSKSIDIRGKREERRDV